MGCNCAGSTPRNTAKATPAPPAREPNPRRVGGPGEPGYAWNGPPRPAEKK